MYGEYVLIYLVAFMLSVFLVPWVRRLALRVGAIDQPDGIRKIHSQAVPRMGGVAIYIAFVVPVVLACLLAYFWFHKTQTYVTVWPPAQNGFQPPSNVLKLAGLLRFAGRKDGRARRHSPPPVARPAPE